MIQQHFLREGILLMSLLIGLTQTQSKYPEVLEDEKLSLDPISFQYEIFYNLAFHFGKPDLGTRNMAVLIQEKDFSEENLKELIKLLSKGYAKPKMLYVEVVTSRDQIRPSRWPRSGDEPDPPNFPK